MPNSLPHAFGRSPVIEKPSREDGLPVSGYPVYTSAGTRCDELCWSLTSSLFSCPLPDQFITEGCGARAVPEQVIMVSAPPLIGWLFTAAVVCGLPSILKAELPSRDPISRLYLVVSEAVTMVSSLLRGLT